jgi:hypothetical protein
VHSNTAWVKDATQGWITADKYSAKPLNTSLAIQPLVRNDTTYQSIETVPVFANNYFYYNRSERILTLKESLNTGGQIAVYSISGQLFEKIQIPPDQTTFVLHSQPKGTIGIVKITSDYFSSAGKIMY